MFVWRNSVGFAAFSTGERSIVDVVSGASRLTFSRYHERLWNGERRGLLSTSGSLLLPSAQEVTDIRSSKGDESQRFTPSFLFQTPLHRKLAKICHA
jgi:hypothetical protein